MEQLARPLRRSGPLRARLLRAPARRPRALGAPRRGRQELHLEVPEDLLRMIALGGQVPARAASGYWDLVEEHLAAWVQAQLPSGARDISVTWNEELWEVAISWNPRGYRFPLETSVPVQ